jgi:cytochrome c oxidase assembly protein subunit 15
MAPASHTPHRRIRQLAAAATATTFVLIAVGALVRATGSGLGCTGWPKCSAHRWLPPLEYHALVEYAHRMTAFVDVVLVALLAFFAWRRYRSERRVFRPAIAAAVLVVFQAVLGGIVVKGDLHALLVTAHFMTAMVLAGTLVVATVAAFSIGLTASPIRSMDGLARLAWLTATGLFALLGVGAYVRGEGAGLAFGDWPLMGGRLIPRLSHLAAALHFAHRALALVVFVLAVALVLAAWRARSHRPAVARLAMLAVGLFAAQILVGAANVWSRLAPAAITAHVAVAGLLWGTVVAAAEASRLPSARSVEHPVILPADPSGSFAESHAGTVRP